MSLLLALLLTQTTVVQQGKARDGGVSWPVDATGAGMTAEDPAASCAIAGTWRGKTCRTVNVMGRRNLGWNSTSVLGDVCQYLDTSQDKLNAVDSAVPYYVRSSSTSDIDGGTGARGLRVVYLQTDGGQTREDVTMNGTTAVALRGGDAGISYIQWAEVTDTGSNTVAVGNITISTVTGVPTVAQTVEYIALGGNRSLCARYKIPGGFNGYLVEWHATASGGATMDTLLRSYTFADDSLASNAVHFKDTAFVTSGGGVASIGLHYVKLPALTEVFVSAIPSAAPAVNRLDVGFDILLVAE